MHTVPENAAAAANADLVRALPRHVTGFSTEIVTAMDLADLQASLADLVEASAFHLESLHEGGPSSTGIGRSVRAEFTLCAPNGTTGDPQIFALLRNISARHRWNTVAKRLSH